ncbi:MAG: AmmeMemoRadiSam system protein A [Gammaproteobacteria bacterium]
MTDNDHKGLVLLTIARSAIAEHFGIASDKDFSAEWLQERAATFVTLNMRGKLRGCIGTLEAWRSLGTDVYENAQAASFRDPRFPPVTQDELERIDMEVSLLAAPVKLNFSDETDAISKLNPGVDGVIFEYGSHRSTFLPQVWTQLPEPKAFLSQLKLKARLPATFWDPQVVLHTYSVQKWRELDFIGEVMAR